MDKHQGLSPATTEPDLMVRRVNYWDYVQVDTLLTLQRPVTDYPDEFIFVVYHQVTELTFRMMLHELEQVCVPGEVPAEKLLEKLRRLSRYTTVLMKSFDVMRDGMDYDQYNVFRTALAPASGFQSAQYRKIEIMCTRLHNLSSAKEHADDINAAFAKIYWQAAGTNPETGAKNETLTAFEHKYLKDFKALAATMQASNIGAKIGEALARGGELASALKEEARNFDNLYNVRWPMVHISTAQHYLDKKGENKPATGGSEWKKYLHPMHQRRIFFPELWTAQELEFWGHTLDEGK